MACHFSPPTRGNCQPSQSSPMTPPSTASCPAESDFPNYQLPRSAPGLRHNTTAPFAPHALPAALACTRARAGPTLTAVSAIKGRGVVRLCQVDTT
eukprot:scaffold157_cov70-Phaeocystis_antarctica.AAC.1